MLRKRETKKETKKETKETKKERKKNTTITKIQTEDINKVIKYTEQCNTCIILSKIY